MTREDAKKAAEIMLAYSEGKTIELYDVEKGKWLERKEPQFNWLTVEYRIKPESKYCPFDNESEFLNEAQKHTPIGWVKHKIGKYCQQITCVSNSGNVHVGPIDYDILLKYYTFMDGEPCGIKEE